LKNYIPSLDGWRAIAISLVIAAHCYTMLMNGGGRLQVMAARFVSHAGYGVDVFFSLSGFLICTLLLKEKEKTGTISLSRFYTRRVFRILPPMLVFLCTVAVLSHLQLIPAIDKIDFIATIGFFAITYTGTGTRDTFGRLRSRSTSTQLHRSPFCCCHGVRR
jgi:peptidoglycan/LPS O-acetylase OafA/YrhL